MAYRKHPFSAKVEFSPREAADEIVRLYARESSQQAVARALDCTEETVCRWIARLEKAGTKIKARLAREKRRAIAEGRHHDRNRQGGRPPGKSGTLPRARKKLTSLAT